MRNGANGGSGIGGVFVLIPIVFVCGVLAVVAATRAEAFKPQPSQAVVSAAYATRVRIENDAIEARLAADLTHAKNINEASEQFMQTARDLLIVAGGAGLIALLTIVGTHSYQRYSYTRLHSRVLNPSQLSPELQVEAHAWFSRVKIADSLSRTKTLAMTANHERGLLRSTAMPASPAPGQLPPPIMIGAPPALPAHDDATGIHIHTALDADDPVTQATPRRAVVNTSRGNMPADIGTEEDFNAYISRNH